MKVDIFSYTLFQTMFDNYIPELRDTQCAYSVKLQKLFINMFFNRNANDADTNSDILMPFCFKLNGVYLYPKTTFDIDQIETPLIIVSDDFYETYFTNPIDLVLHVVYNLPDVDLLELKSDSCDIQDIETVTLLLVEYFNSCSIVNIGQKFTLKYNTGDITFEVSDIKYKNEIVSDINMRFEELNKSVKFNEELSTIYSNENLQPYIESKSFVVDYRFYYDKIKNKIADAGYLVNNEVKIDFKLAEKPIIEPDVQLYDPLPTHTQKQSSAQPEGKMLGGSSFTDCDKPLTMEEVRQKRLAYIEKNK